MCSTVGESMKNWMQFNRRYFTNVFSSEGALKSILLKQSCNTLKKQHVRILCQQCPEEKQMISFFKQLFFVDVESLNFSVPSGFSICLSECGYLVPAPKVFAEDEVFEFWINLAT